MNSRIYKYLFVFSVFMLGVNVSVNAQNKEKPTMKKTEVNSMENEEQAIKLLEERMQTASPEEKAKIQQRINAYYGKEGKRSESLAQAKEEVQQAYFQYQESETKLETAKAAIEESEAKLIQMEKEGKLSTEEIAVRRQKLEKAKEELDKSQVALKKQMAAIKAKRAEMVKSE